MKENGVKEVPATSLFDMAELFKFCLTPKIKINKILAKREY